MDSQMFVESITFIGRQAHYCHHLFFVVWVGWFSNEGLFPQLWSFFFFSYLLGCFAPLLEHSLAPGYFANSIFFFLIGSSANACAVWNPKSAIQWRWVIPPLLLHLWVIFCKMAGTSSKEQSRLGVVTPWTKHCLLAQTFIRRRCRNSLSHLSQRSRWVILNLHPVRLFPLVTINYIFPFSYSHLHQHSITCSTWSHTLTLSL